MNKKEVKTVQKQINNMEKVLRRLEIRPCKGDIEIKQKDIEIVDLNKQLRSLKNERDGHIYGLH